MLALMCAILSAPAAADDGIWVTQVNPTRGEVTTSDANRRSEFKASPSNWSYDASHVGVDNHNLQMGTLNPELDIRQSGMRNTVTPLLSAGSGRVRERAFLWAYGQRASIGSGPASMGRPRALRTSQGQETAP